MSFEVLNRALFELEGAMRDCGSKLILGGGFGLFRCQTQMGEDESKPTLIRREAWCAPRATADLDIFLETSILASIEQMQAIRSCLDVLGYAVIDGVEFLHFEKNFSAAERVEINFLTGPITDQKLAKKVQDRRPRARARGKVQLHAYLTEEAVALSENLRAVFPVPDRENTNLFVPHPATLLVMKLHAFRDRFVRGEQEKSGHHAIDVYRILCLLDETTFAECKGILNRNANVSAVFSAGEIVERYFQSADQMGFVKIREHALYRDHFDLETMRSVLQELLTFSN